MMMVSSFSLASLSNEKSCGYLIFDATQVASSMIVPLFPGSCSGSAFDSSFPPPEGGFVWSSSFLSLDSFCFRASSIYSLASMITSIFRRLRNNTNVLASIGRRKGFATRPFFPLNSLEYFFSNASQGMASAIFTHLFSGFI